MHAVPVSDFYIWHNNAILGVWLHSYIYMYTYLEETSFQVMRVKKCQQHHHAYRGNTIA